MKIELPDDFVDYCVVESLKNSYVWTQNDMTRLRQKDQLKDYEREDLENFAETAQGLEIVLRYYMVRSEADTFINQNRSKVVDNFGE